MAGLCYLPGLAAHLAYAIVSFVLVVSLGVPGLYLAIGIASVLYMAAIRAALVAGQDRNNGGSPRFHGRQSAMASLVLLVYALSSKVALAASVGATLSLSEGLAPLVFLVAFIDLVVMVAAAAGWGLLIVQSSRGKLVTVPLIGRLATQLPAGDRTPVFQRVTKRAA